jgi:hypothetical protein
VNRQKEKPGPRNEFEILFEGEVDAIVFGAELLFFCSNNNVPDLGIHLISSPLPRGSEWLSSSVDFLKWELKIVVNGRELERLRQHMEVIHVKSTRQ